MNAITDIAHLIDLKEGEKLAFGIILPDGKTTYTILLPGQDRKSWNDGMAWAKEKGGDLPDRAQQALLHKYLPDEFEQDWYWSNTQHADDSDCAWYQGFDDGTQLDTGKDYELLVRAVRSVTI